MTYKMIKKMVAGLALLLLILISFSSCALQGTLDQDPELSIKFGLDAAKRGLWREAILRWENALKIRPNDAKTHNNLGIAYENQGDYDKAELHYKKGLELDPSNENIRINYNNFSSFVKTLQSKKTNETGGPQNAENR